MCLICFNEFEDCNPAVDLCGCGHVACRACLDSLGLEHCPVCARKISAHHYIPPPRWPDSALFWEGLQGCKAQPSGAASDLHDVRDGDELGCMDASSQAWERMSVAASTSGRSCGTDGGSSSSSGRVALRRAGRCASVCGVTLLRGSWALSRLLVRRVMLPATVRTAVASHAVLSGVCRALVVSGAVAACGARRAARFVGAQRCVIQDVDGDSEPELQLQPISNLQGCRIILRDCRRVRIRIEYCRDCVLVASSLCEVELLMVGCQRVKVVLRKCNFLALRELQCRAMGDFVRKGCDNFVHDHVCLRCACQGQVRQPPTPAALTA